MAKKRRLTRLERAESGQNPPKSVIKSVQEIVIECTLAGGGNCGLDPPENGFLGCMGRDPVRFAAGANALRGRNAWRCRPMAAANRGRFAAAGRRQGDSALHGRELESGGGSGADAPLSPKAPTPHTPLAASGRGRSMESFADGAQSRRPA